MGSYVLSLTVSLSGVDVFDAVSVATAVGSCAVAGGRWNAADPGGGGGIWNGRCGGWLGQGWR